MENKHDVAPHPQFLEVLFAFKNKVSYLFKDILGLHDIHHMTLTQIDKNNKFLSLSSTPALEFNLFNSNLWRYDQSYNPQWFNLCAQAPWQTLYTQARYDELYYLKQIKHKLPIGLSLATKIKEHYVIYSLASHKSCPHTHELFSTQKEEFYKIGHYCSNILHPLFNYYEPF